ncbi:MAG: DoxX family protein [Balneolaceae bacterium]
MEPVQNPSKNMIRTGWALSLLAALFFAFDGISKIMTVEPVIAEMTRLGFPESTIVGVGILLLTCTIIYIYPRTAIVGAILLTGYLGGAIATHVRMESPLFSHTLFPLYLGLMVWGGLYLRNLSVRNLNPI